MAKVVDLLRTMSKSIFIKCHPGDYDRWPHHGEPVRRPPKRRTWTERRKHFNSCENALPFQFGSVKCGVWGFWHTTSCPNNKSLRLERLKTSIRTAILIVLFSVNPFLMSFSSPFTTFNSRVHIYTALYVPKEWLKKCFQCSIKASTTSLIMTGIPVL